MNQQTTTGADKARSYSGDYMAAGKKAEEIVMRYLQSKPYIIGLNDFRELRAVQEADVDIAIKTIDGRVTLAEIKSDWHLGVSGNVLFEVLRINHTAPPERSGSATKHLWLSTCSGSAISALVTSARCALFTGRAPPGEARGWS